MSGRPEDNEEMDFANYMDAAEDYAESMGLEGAEFKLYKGLMHFIYDEAHATPAELGEILNYWTPELGLNEKLALLTTLSNKGMILREYLEDEDVLATYPIFNEVVISYGHDVDLYEV